MHSLEKLFYLTGVAADYLDYGGQRRRFSHEERLRVLRASGYPVDDAQALEEVVFELDASPWQQLLRPLYIVSEQEPVLSFHCHPDALEQAARWELTAENGTVFEGEVLPAACPQTGDYLIGQTRYSARLLDLRHLTSAAVPNGYHSLSLRHGGVEGRATVVVTPAQCHDVLKPGEKAWGISCQLYTLRSARNWGIGDFTDLKELIELAAPMGADLIGLNPLHAPCSDSADLASPYSPSDRRFLNPLYVDPQDAPGFDDNLRVQALLENPEILREWAALRRSDLVDYGRVSRLKYRLYHALYLEFSERCLRDPRMAAQFQAFVADQGTALEKFSRYEADHNPYAAEYEANPKFHQFLQWLAARQYQSCQDLAIERGMRIGLVGDLAVGSVGAGCEVRTNTELYVAGAAIGAPPDPFSDAGQDWGLPPPDPVALRDNGFKHFISLLRANMRHCGALRFDHVMGLMRLWWCIPESGDRPRTGVYVYYPLQELLALVRLESQRNKCLVIGEDLGVVPSEIRRLMAESGVYGNDVLYFDKHRDGRFKQPHERRAHALLMVTSHDVPPLADWWNGTDLHRRRDLGLIPSRHALDTLLGERQRDKHALLRWLGDNELLPPGHDRRSAAGSMDFPLCEAIHRACARSASQLLLLQLEDLQLMDTPVNIPATSTEYPNWRRRQVQELSDIFAGSDVQRLLNAVDHERASA